MGVDRDLFRRTMAQLATGVTAVTTLAPDGFHGFAANAFCQVSASPPLVLVCIDRLSRGHDYVLRSGVFAVSILSRRQEFLADRLAGRAPGLSRRFEGVAYLTASTGAPILQGCAAWLDCRVEAAHPAGDHTIVLGRVEALGQGDSLEPLLIFHSAYLRSPLVEAQPR